jgi:hypothetical protein
MKPERVRRETGSAEELTPADRHRLQDDAVREYLERLDRNQWRDPVSGQIVARRQRRARQIQLARRR